MEFKEIVARLTSGQKIRRTAWPGWIYLEYNGSSVSMKTTGLDNMLAKFAVSDRLFSLEEVLADDWEIIK